MKRACIIDDKDVRFMKNTALNDLAYDFEPLEIFIPDPNYKADEAALQESKKKSKELMAFAQDYLQKMDERQ